MVQVIITQHGNILTAHVMPIQEKLPSFIEENIVCSFNVSQILLKL